MTGISSPASIINTSSGEGQAVQKTGAKLSEFQEGGSGCQASTIRNVRMSCQKSQRGKENGLKGKIFLQKVLPRIHGFR